MISPFPPVATTFVGRLPKVIDDVSAEKTISMWLHDEGLDMPEDGSIDSDYHYKLKK